jgi:hypothetical protein
MCIHLVATRQNRMTRQNPVGMNQNQALIPDQAIAVNHHLQALQVLLVEQLWLGELQKSSRRRKEVVDDHGTACFAISQIGVIDFDSCEG